MTTRQKTRLFFSPLSASVGRTIVILIYSLFAGFYSTFLVVIIGWITDSIDAGNASQIKAYLGVFVCLIIVNYLTKIFYRPTNFRIARDVSLYLDRVYLHKFMLADNNQVEKIGTGRMISIVNQGIFNWTWTLLELLRDKTVRISTVLFSLSIILFKSWQFFLICIALVVCAYPFVRFFGKKAHSWRKKVKNVNVELDRMSVRWIMSKFEIQQQDKYDYELDKRKILRNAWYTGKHREKYLQALGYDSLILSIEILLVLVAGFVSFGVLQGSYSVGDFVLLTGLALLFQREMFGLLQEVRKMFDNLIHVDKMIETFAGFRTRKNYNTGKTFTHIHGNFVFDNVTYSYDNNKVFDRFSLDIQGGKKTALVGTSGGGKSTLIKLIAGYLTPDSGSLLIDGQDLSKIKLKTYYSHIGYLTQDPSVFDGTIYENLVYALDYVPTQKQLDRTIKDAGCEFIYDFTAGLQTEIGERGIRLSGGQKQRLAIAKIFLKDPEIILLDEPTSALDSVSEEKISQALHRLFAGRTVVVVAHRLQTVKEADDIIVIEDGMVIERGTHAQLGKKKGPYAKMLELQTTF